jgi:hypothetical protein
LAFFSVSWQPSQTKEGMYKIVFVCNSYSVSATLKKERMYQPSQQDEQYAGAGGGGNRMFFDGKRMRKAVIRKTVDFNASLFHTLDHIMHGPSSANFRHYPPVLPESSYILNVCPTTHAYPRPILT